jgi:hypothetical protein
VRFVLHSAVPSSLLEPRLLSAEGTRIEMLPLSFEVVRASHCRLAGDCVSRWPILRILAELAFMV